MEEKVLIESRPSKVWRIIFLLIVIGIFAIMFLFWGLQIAEMYVEYSVEKAVYYPHSMSFWTYYFDRPFWDSTLVLSIFVFTFLGLALIALVMYLGYIRSKLSITEMNIRGATRFGKEVVLPLHMVSGYSTSAIMAKMVVSTPSGVIKFYMLDNYREIGEVLKDLLNKRQKNTETESKTKGESSINFQTTYSNADELKKYKELLDSGVITQEEFEVKKKRLLDL